MIKVTSYLISDIGTVLEKGVEMPDKRGFGYLHSNLENEYNKLGGYDIPCFLTDNVPTEPGIYNAVAVFPDREVNCTFYVWLRGGKPNGLGLTGLIVDNSNIDAVGYAMSKYKEQAFSI